MVFCTEFLDGWWSWEPVRKSCVRCGWCRAPSAPYTRPTRPPPFQKLGAENHMLQLNIQCSWWWAYVPEIFRAKNTSIKLPNFIKLYFTLFHVKFLCDTIACDQLNRSLLFLSRELCYAILPQIELRNFSNNSLFLSNNFIILGNYRSVKR